MDLVPLLSSQDVALASFGPPDVIVAHLEIDLEGSPIQFRNAEVRHETMDLN